MGQLNVHADLHSRAEKLFIRGVILSPVKSALEAGIAVAARDQEHFGDMCIPFDIINISGTNTLSN